MSDQVLEMKSEITVIVKAWAHRNAVKEYKARMLLYEISSAIEKFAIEYKWHSAEPEP
jgi:hypothetical protein